MAYSLKKKVNLGIFVVLVILAIMGGFSYREGRHSAETDGWVLHTRMVLDLCESLRSEFADAGAARRVFVSTGDEKQVHVFDTESAAALGQITALRQAVADNPPQENRLTELDAALRARFSMFKQSIDLRRSSPADTKGQEAIAEVGVNLALHVSDQLHLFEMVERGLLQQRVAKADVVTRRANLISNSLGVLVFVLLIVAVWIVNRELSRSSKAEMAVLKARKLLESILNSCGDVVVVADERGKVILRNPAADLLYRTAPGESLPPNYAQILGFYTADGVTPFAAQDLPLARTIRGESVHSVEVYVQRPDLPDGRYYLAAGAPLLDEGGNHRGGVIFLRDITERKLDTERLAAALLESERNAREQRELTRLMELFQTCLDVNEACKVVEALCGEIFESRPGMLCLTNSSRNMVEGCAKWCDCSTAKDLFEPSDCWGLRQGKPFEGSRGSGALRCSHVIGSHADYLCVPLVAQGETYGVLYVEDKPAAPDAGAEAIASEKKQLLQLATAVAERISLAVANLKLREVLRVQSIQDPLTGLFNRRYLEESLEREVHRAARAGRSAALVLLDIDHFKKFNDTFGHQSGDVILKEVASIFKARVRAGDLACRFGGEEFALILSEADANGARMCVEKILDNVKQLALQFRGQSLGTVTVSAGVACFPANGDNSTTLIHMADTALYRAKREGRDRVVVCEEHELAHLEGAS
jgi:diguanylate cyclase (GGDEF)-like protein